MEQSKILMCSCKSEFQDATYGSQKRVHNSCGKDGKSTGFRCTICLNVKAGKSEVAKPTTKK